MTDARKLVEPHVLKGFQDLLPEAALTRAAVIDAIRPVFERYGFVPLESPALEYLEALLGTGGEETNKELFRLQTPEGEAAGLRFDQTVPFARMLAQYPDKLKAPFRRYAVGPSWRADKPGPGRFRQFTQLDIDIAGAATIAADAELVAVADEALTALGADACRILINNRRVMDALLGECGIEDDAVRKHVLRVIDKLDKVGLDNVRLELGPGRIDDSGDPIRGAQLDDGVIARVLDFIAIEGATRAEVIDRLDEALGGGEAAEAVLEEMREFDACLQALGVDDERAPFRPSLARGLDYYTGPVFEVAVPGWEGGSIAGGGRYDDLVARFLDRRIPCTGLAFGLERLIGALDYLGAAPRRRTTVQALVVGMGKTPKSELLKLAQELRDAGISTEPYFGKKKGMKHQLGHADHYGIPVAVIVGEDELAAGTVSIKDLEAGKREREHIEDRDAYRQAGRVAQQTVARGEMVATVRAILGAA